MGSSTEQQKYSLKWNDFSGNVTSAFRELFFGDEAFCDVTLALKDGATLRAHKLILSSVSTYFSDILRSVNVNNGHVVLVLKDTSEEEAAAILEFAYTGQVNVGQELLPSLLNTAKEFRIKGLDKVEPPEMEEKPAMTSPPAKKRWKQLSTEDGTSFSSPVKRQRSDHDVDSCNETALDFSQKGRSTDENGDDFVVDMTSKPEITSSETSSAGYTCSECGKYFKHPGSLQHHRHIHRGTHRCPTCGKAFSRRWDLDRHMKKSKYGCPAGRANNGVDDEEEEEEIEDIESRITPAQLKLLTAVTGATLKG